MLKWSMVVVAMAGMVLAGTGEASAASRLKKLAEQSDAAIYEQSASAFADDKIDRAREGFAELAARNPRDASVHTLLALSFHRSADENPQAVDLASAGYDLALNAQPSNFWAAAFAGRAAWDRREYDVATSRFAQAVLARPTDGRAMFALASAAYMAGDIELAAVAAERAVQLNGDTADRVPSLRLATLTNVATQRGDVARAHLAVLQEVDPAVARDVRLRMVELEQTNGVDAAGTDGAASGGAGDPAAAEWAGHVPQQHLDQISVDVAIVMSQRTKRDRIGLNLMDGLSLNYGYGRTYNDVRNQFTGSDPVNTRQRVITRAITIPQLDYNLNLFNRAGQYYSVVARPSLTAYRGETSEFFIGRTLKVAVSGVNFSSLEQIDIGIEMKVTPIEITNDRTRVRVETSRSFLTEDAAGNFQEGLSTFRQKVAATAEVGFGETLILSGLSESVEDNTFSKTPLLGDLPVVGAVFNERSKQSRRDAALMLITPALPGSLPARPQIRADALAKIARLWTEVVDPGSNARDIGTRLSRVRLFTRAQPNDSPLAWPSLREQSLEALRELILPHVD